MNSNDAGGKAVKLVVHLVLNVDGEGASALLLLDQLKELQLDAKVFRLPIAQERVVPKLATQHSKFSRPRFCAGDGNKLAHQLGNVTVDDVDGEFHPSSSLLRFVLSTEKGTRRMAYCAFSTLPDWSFQVQAQNIFVIDPSSLGEMDAKSGTALICSILRCEATRLQIPIQNVVISSKLSAKDGGVDAKVEDVPNAAHLLKKGSSYLQIKTGTSFKPWLKPQLLKELFGKKIAKPSKPRLGKEIRTCLGKNGRYVLVTLGHDLLPTQHSDAVALLSELFKKCGYKKPAV